VTRSRALYTIWYVNVMNFKSLCASVVCCQSGCPVGALIFAIAMSGRNKNVEERPSIRHKWNRRSREWSNPRALIYLLGRLSNARDVWPQSFNLDDVLYWLHDTPRFAWQAVLLDDRVYDDNGLDSVGYAEAVATMPELAAEGVRIVAPPMWALVEERGGEIVPWEYALAARDAGLSIITWTLERSGPLVDGGGWYFQTISDVTDNDGVYFELLDVLAKDVGVIGVFSDWPATTTFYANCSGLK